jgi:hypothetical protein
MDNHLNLLRHLYLQLIDAEAAAERALLFYDGCASSDSIYLLAQIILSYRNEKAEESDKYTRPSAVEGSEYIDAVS